jgi:predicted methyltransferase
VAKLSEKHQFILYSLYKYLTAINKRFENEPLAASIMKIDFIKLLLALKIVEKSERALYRNLEILEEQKYLKYESNFLKLTTKGLKMVRKIEQKIHPFQQLWEQINNGDVRTLKAVQSYFK